MNVNEAANRVMSKLAGTDPTPNAEAIAPIIIEVIFMLMQFLIEYCNKEASEAPVAATELRRRDNFRDAVRYRSVCRWIRYRLGREDYTFFMSQGGLDALLEAAADANPDEVQQLWGSMGG